MYLGLFLFGTMKKLLLTSLLILGAYGPAQAQAQIGEEEPPQLEMPEFIKNLGERIEEAQNERPDYSHLPPEAEKKAKLQDLFKRLQLESDADKGNLLAEEIWAIWLDSGSASVDLLLRRGTAADKNGDNALARRMFDHVTDIKPEYAEGWARSGRLAYEEDDYNRAVIELTEALIIEPRHFFALWTMGNIMEELGRNDEALAIYSEAHKLYPSLPTLKQRTEYLENQIQGEVL